MMDLIIAAGLCIAIDGDTLRCGEMKVRLWGIDTAEFGQPGSVAAHRALQQYTKYELHCETKGMDRYKRVVAKCFVGDKDVACELVKAGHAVDWSRYSKGFYASCGRTFTP